MQTNETELRLMYGHITLPCFPGTTLYSTIGEKVEAFVVDRFSHDVDEDGEEVYMITKDGLYLKSSCIGKYYFFSQEEALTAFNNSCRKRSA